MPCARALPRLPRAWAWFTATKRRCLPYVGVYGTPVCSRNLYAGPPRHCALCQRVTTVDRDYSRIMAGNGAEKRKADEMTADSVELPLAELKSLAEKGGEQEAHGRTRSSHQQPCITLCEKMTCVHERRRDRGRANTTSSARPTAAV